MANQSLVDRISLIGTSIAALQNQDASFEREDEAKKMLKKLTDLIDETRAKEKWLREHNSDDTDALEQVQKSMSDMNQYMENLKNVLGPTFDALKRDIENKKKSNYGEFQSIFESMNPDIPVGSVRSRYGRGADFIGNLGGLFGSSKLQNAASIMTGETDLTSGKMMKVAEKLHFAGALVGGNRTALGRKILKGRDFFERNKSFLSDYLKGKVNRELENPFPGAFPNAASSDQQETQGIISQSSGLGNGNPLTSIIPQQSNQGVISHAPNRNEQERALRSLGKKIAKVIKKFLAPEGFDEQNRTRIREMRKMNKIFKKLNRNMVRMNGVLGKFMDGLSDKLKGLTGKQSSSLMSKAFDNIMASKFGKGLKDIFKGGAGMMRGALRGGVGILSKAIRGVGPIIGRSIAMAAPLLGRGILGVLGKAGILGATLTGSVAVGTAINNHILQPKIDKAYDTPEGKAKIDKWDNRFTKSIGKYLGVPEKAGGKNTEHNSAQDTNFDIHIGQHINKDSKLALNEAQRNLVLGGALKWEHLSEDQQKAIGKENFDQYAKNQKAKVRSDGTEIKSRYENASPESIIDNSATKSAVSAGQTTLAKSSSGNIKTTQVSGQSLGDIVTSHEGTYDDVNRGAAHGYKSAKRNLTSMTVEQVMELQDSKDFNAAGKPQVIRDTLKELVKQGVIDPKAMFDEKTQNDILVHLMEKRAGGYITGRHDDINASLVDISREWSSTENPETGRSYYDKDGVNKAHTSAADVGKGLEQARELYQQNIAAGMSHKEAFRAAVLGQKATGEQSAPGEIKTQPQSEAAKVAALSEVGAPGSERFGLKMNADGSISKESISQNFSTRGKVDLTGMNPLFMSRANSFADEFKSLTGENIIATEGHRSKAEQERLYNLYKEGKGNLAARPGTSNHGHGLAMDLSAKNMEAVLRRHPEVIKQLGAKNARDAIDKLAAKHGLHRPMKHRADEQQHFEMIKDQEYKDNINEAMIAEVRGKSQSGSYKGSSYLKEDSGYNINRNRTNVAVEDSFRQEALAAAPPPIKIPPQMPSGGGKEQPGAKMGGTAMGAGTQDHMMAFMFGAYGYPTHLG